MKTLHLLPTPYRNQSIVKTAFAFDKVIACCLITLGKSLRHIQTLLGKSSSETTVVCTHISKKSLANIKTPSDWLIEEQNTDNIIVTIINV